MLNIYKNFKKYAKYGIIPGIKKHGHSVPQNSFYKSVHYIDSIVGPVKDTVFGIKVRDTASSSAKQLYIGKRDNDQSGIIFYFMLTLANMFFQPFYLILAYLSYLPAKLILQQNTEALVNYSNMLSSKADTHSIIAAQFVNTVLSYIFSAVIWTAALALTPVVFIAEKAYDAVRSKFSDVEEPEPSNRTGKQVV